MADDIEFVDGLIIKEPHERAPDFVKGKGSIKVAELIEWLQKRETQWVNFDIKVSRAGKWYCAVDNWDPTKDQQYKEGMQQVKQAAEPAPAPAGGTFDDDIPFSNYEWRELV